MACGRELALVAAVALAAGCGSGATTAGTSSVPPGGAPGGGTSGADGGAAGGGVSDGGTTARPCERLPVAFAANATVATADASYLYAFSDHELLRIPLGGDRRDVLVDDIDISVDFDASVDDRYVYWLVRDGNGVVPALVRAPKSGGAALFVGTGGGELGTRSYVITDRVYLIEDIDLFWYFTDGSGGGQVPSSQQVNRLTANATQLFWLGVDNDTNEVPLHTVALAAPATARPIGGADADDRYVYVAWGGSVRRYRIADGSWTQIAQFAGEAAPTDLRVVDGTLYVHAGDGIVRMATDGSNQATLAGGAVGPWTIGGDSVYFTDFNGSGIRRVCR